MSKLSIIPGLGFLDRWVTEFRGTRTAISQRVGDLEAYRDVAQEGFGDVSGAVRGDDDADQELVEDGTSDDHSDLDYDDGERYENEEDYDDDYKWE